MTPLPYPTRVPKRRGGGPYPDSYGDDGSGRHEPNASQCRCSKPSQVKALTHVTWPMDLGDATSQHRFPREDHQTRVRTLCRDIIPRVDQVTTSREPRYRPQPKTPHVTRNMLINSNLQGGTPGAQVSPYRGSSLACKTQGRVSFPGGPRTGHAWPQMAVETCVCSSPDGKTAGEPGSTSIR